MTPAATPSLGMIPTYHEAKRSATGEFEKDYVTKLVKAFAGNLSEAARHADVDRGTLALLMERHGITRPKITTRRPHR